MKKKPLIDKNRKVYKQSFQVFMIERVEKER